MVNGTGFFDFPRFFLPGVRKCFEAAGLILDSPEAVAEMRNLQLSGQYRLKALPNIELNEDRFLWFRLEEDPRLREEEVYFGPETISIEWSRK